MSDEWDSTRAMNDFKCRLALALRDPHVIALLKKRLADEPTPPAPPPPSAPAECQEMTADRTPV